MSRLDKIRAAAHALECAERATVWSVAAMWRRRAATLLQETRPMAIDLTDACDKGYRYDPDACVNPYAWGSDSWLAYEAGQALATREAFARGAEPDAHPAQCHKARGHSVRMTTRGGMRYIYRAAGSDLHHRSLLAV